MDSSLLQTFNKLTTQQQRTTLQYLLQGVAQPSQTKEKSDQQTDSVYQIMSDYLYSTIQQDPKLYLVFFQVLAQIISDHDAQQTTSRLHKQQQLKSALDKIHQQEMNQEESETLLQDILLS